MTALAYAKNDKTTNHTFAITDVVPAYIDSNKAVNFNAMPTLSCVKADDVYVNTVNFFFQNIKTRRKLSYIY